MFETMADIVPLTAFQAIENQIKTLCLRDFPCGIGSWHKTDNLSKNWHQKSGSKAKEKYENIQLDIEYPVSVKADQENSEQLVDLITYPQSPWYMDYSWSREASSLRETAIKSPRLINPNFVYSFFRTMNINDKAVTEIDAGLLRFNNLEEITLSANYITAVNTSCLPSSLKVLELCANDIKDINDLCNRPPPLQHLGLGRNQISSVGDCISGTFWPDLVSLDLSYNDLCGLADIVKTFSTLPKLRNLNLQGNPVSLIAGYRGYVVDSLRNLTVLDDKQISVDEQYNFNGLAKREGLLYEDAIVQLSVLSLKGLPCPPEIMHPESQPEYPVIEKSYFVQFMLPLVHHESSEKTEPQSAQRLTDGTSASDVAALADVDGSSLQQKLLTDEQPHDDVECKPEKDSPEENPCKEKNESVVDVPEKTETSAADVVRQTLETEGTPPKKTEPVNSSFLPWEEEMYFSWTRDIILSDLLTLRDFFKSGMDIHVMEQTVESQPAWTTGGKDTFFDRNVDAKAKKKNKEPEKAKERPKKKRDSTEEWLKSPPKFKSIASFHVPLEGFLNGAHEYETKLTKLNNLSQTSIPSKLSEDRSVQEKSKDKGRASVKSPSFKKDLKKSQADFEKTPGKRKHVLSIDEALAPAELQLFVSVRLCHWVTAADAVTVTKHDSSNEIINVNK